MIEAKIKLSLLIILVVIATSASVFFLTTNNYTEVKSASWYDSAWGNRKKITINNTEVDADLTDFPVYVNMANLGADFFNSVKSDGTDIVITSSDGITKLARELVEFNKAGNTGELWFKAPTLANLTDTEFYIYYGNSSGAETNSTALWSGYTLVEHLEEDPSGIAPQVHDSKGSFNFSSFGTMTSGDLVPAKLGKGLDFDGTNDYLQTATALGISGAGARTMSLWFRLDGTVGKKMIGYGSNSNAQIFDLMTSNVNTFIGHFYGGGNDTNSGSPGVSASTWYYGTITYNGSTANVYLNGNFANSKAIALNTGNTVFRIGNGGYSGSSLMDGILDEVRVSNNVKTATWISTEYSNQSAPGSFYVIGSEESQSAGAWYNQNWSYRVKFTIFEANVFEDVTNFPVYVDLSDMEAAFFTSVKSNGSDIVVTAGDGVTKLDRELVVLDTSAQTGELWFKAPALSSTVDTDFYIYFGNTDGAETNTTAVWSNGYALVQHLEEGTTGATDYRDSSANALHSTAVTIDGAGSNPTAVGQIDGAVQFDGVNDTIDIGDNSLLEPSTTMTLSAWVKPDILPTVLGHASNIITKTGGGYSYQFGINQTQNCVYFQWRNTVPTSYIAGSTAGGCLNNTNWFYLTGVHDGTTLRYYQNGDNTFGYTDSPTGTIFNSTGALKTGSAVAGFEYDGFVDEVRLSTVARSLNWTKTEYYNQSTPATFYEIEEIEAIADWYDDSWPYRIKITVDPAYVFENVVDFPVYVDLSDLGVDFFNNVKSDGTDIVVTAADGITKLDRELVSIDTGADTGELWFKALSLSDTYDTDFYIYFGKPSAAETNTTAVWSNSYSVVQHMNEDPSGAAPQMQDSSAANLDGTSGGSMTTGDLVAGQLGTALDFDGTNDFIDLGNNQLQVANNFTASAWVNLDNANPSGIRQIFGTFGRRWALGVESANTNFVGYDGTLRYAQVSAVSGSWIYLTGVKSSTGNGLTLYVNGSSVATNSLPTVSISYVAGSTYIGSDAIDSTGRALDGKIDEVRFSSVKRSTGWIQTEYYNQFSPNVFYTVDEIDTDRILKVTQDTETPNASGQVIVCMQALQEIIADSQMAIYFSSSYSVTGGGNFSDSDFDAYCDSNGEEGGSQVPMSAVSIVSQGLDSIVFDTNADTCSQWMCIDFSGGSKLFENPAAEGNYEWNVTMDIGGNASIEQNQTTLQFVGNLNEVGVSGYIPPLIALDIYENNSDTKTNSCALGVLSINEINSCSYDIGASVNAHSGVSLHMSSDGGLDNGGAEIDACSSTGCTSKGTQGVSVGEEEYGFYISENGGGEFEVTEYYNEQHQPVPQAFTMIASSSSNGSGTVTGSSAQRLELTHAVSIDLATPSGSYSQVLTFRLFSN